MPGSAVRCRRVHAWTLALTAKIHEIHRRSRGAYGAPNIHAELADEHGIRVGCKRVARLMRAAGLRGVMPQRFVTTTVRADAEPLSDDLVKRQFKADGPDQLWVADITYVPTWARLPVPGDRARRLVAQDRRLVHRAIPAHRHRTDGTEHGARSASTARRRAS